RARRTPAQDQRTLPREPGLRVPGASEEKAVKRLSVAGCRLSAPTICPSCGKWECHPERSIRRFCECGVEGPLLSQGLLFPTFFPCSPCLRGEQGFAPFTMTA